MAKESIESQCTELQRQELEVLQAIWPDALTTVGPCEYRLQIPVELDAPTTVQFEASEGAAGPTTVAPVRLSQLPTVSISFALPANYPLEAPPRIVSLFSTHDWLAPASIARAREALDPMWTHGDGILDSWVEWVRGGEMLRALELFRGDTIVIRHSTPHLLLLLLVDYDTRIASDAFNSTAFPCGICESSVKGSRSVQLSCSHVFCRDCLHDYWSFSIREGNVAAVGCANPACLKKHAEATSAEVRQVVANELFERWQWLVLKREAERDPSILSCPMVSCQRPVPRTPGLEHDDSGWSRFRQCPSCSFSFCAFCKRTWHGPIGACAFNNNLQIVLEYMECEKDSVEARNMEVRYGVRNLRKLVAAYQEEQANRAYFDASTRDCPGCETKIQKSQGCNHMTCTRCGKHFCYICREKLLPENPYIHFSTMGQGCYNRLFDQEAIARHNLELTFDDELPI